METIKVANKIIRDGIALLPDEAKGDFKTRENGLFTYEAINNACGAVNEDSEKTAMLEAYAVQEANRVVTMLWRMELLTPELEKAYRELPKMEAEAEAYNQFTADRKARMDKVMEQYNAIHAEEADLDIFKGIINGLSADEAGKRYNEFQKQQQQAMTGGR